MYYAAAEGQNHLDCNSELMRYLDGFAQIERDYLRQAEAFGLPFDEKRDRKSAEKRRGKLAAAGVGVENDSRSLRIGWISPSCVQCRKGVGAMTFGLSVQCPRNCYFCFNSNQADYQRLLTETNDVTGDIERLSENGIKLTDIALTGGEPLVHKEETRRFFKRARELYPQAYMRLYTSGYNLDETTLADFAASNLDEIRFSVKTDEGDTARRNLIDLMGKSRAYVDNVVVEMPVMPNEAEEMKGLLDDLDEAGIAGINLLELCFPLHNANEFARRGFMLKNPPYRILYDYLYAGGLPISGSEEACFDLLEHAASKNYNMGVHYCSLENKFTGQIYLQNKPYCARFPMLQMSEKDHFLKNCKIFGEDARIAEKHLLGISAHNWKRLADFDGIELHPSHLSALSNAIPNVPVAISVNVVETDDAGVPRLRELAAFVTTPNLFDAESDI